MPIACSIPIARTSSDEMGALDFEVMRHAFAVHKELGCLCDESVYHSRLAHALIGAGFQIECEVSQRLQFRAFDKTLYLDMVINRQAIYELKTVSSLTPAHAGQLTRYLFIANTERGKLVNFRPTSVESRFINATMDDKERRRFDIDTQRWSGPDEFRAMVSELVADWGTGLDQSLYMQAIVQSLGGDEVVTRQLPMELDGCPMGNQRFHVLPDGSAFQITTFQGGHRDTHHQQFRKMLAPSPVKTMQWVNISHHHLTLQTISV